MKINFENNIFFELLTKTPTLNASQIPIIFLHGFTGEAKEWEFLFTSFTDKHYPIAIDLNYTCSDNKYNSNFELNTDNLILLINKVYNFFEIDKAIIIGYSMGGRIALSFACKHPEKITALVLESSSPGIIDKIEREQRFKSDSDIANFIIENSLDQFLNFWYSQSMFNSLASYKNELIQKKLKLNKGVLANILINFSTGLMPHTWEKLDKLNFPVLLITGELDTKFTKINSEMKQTILLAEHKIISNAGHNVHLEKNIDFTILVMNFINNL